jgi:DNA-binding PadR family transcriptional regulator
MNYKFDREMGKNEIDMMILGMLRIRPSYGYDLKKRIDFAFAPQYPDLSDSAIYPRLQQFEKDGFVTSRLEVQRHAPNRRIYQLTDPGLNYLRRLVETPVKTGRRIRSSDVQDLLIHIFFFRLISKEKRRIVLEPFHKNAAERYDAIVKQKEIQHLKLDKFALVTLEYGLPMLKLSKEMYERLMEMD